jgi:uncharacterized membrane protein YccC
MNRLDEEIAHRILDHCRDVIRSIIEYQEGAKHRLIDHYFNRLEVVIEKLKAEKGEEVQK